MLFEIIYIFCAYLLGSISAAIIVCRLSGLPDPRSLGSNNPGATNVLRIGGKKPAALTLFGDTLKGFLPVAIAHLFDFSHVIMLFIGLAAFLGHLYPVFFNFRGGKGVATMLGVLFGFAPWIGFVTGIIWLIIAKVFKISSVAGLTASLIAPILVWVETADLYASMLMFIISLLLIWRHRSNIQKLIAGTED